MFRNFDLRAEQTFAGTFDNLKWLNEPLRRFLPANHPRDLGLTGLTTGLSSGFKQELTSQIDHRVGQQHLEVVIVNRVVLRPREHPIGGLVAGHEAAMSDVLLRLASCPVMVLGR
jgi:hypothetical protein